MPYSRYFPQDIKSELKGRMVLIIYTDSNGLHFRSFPSRDPCEFVSRYHPKNKDIHRIYGGVDPNIFDKLAEQGFYNRYAEGLLELTDFDRFLVKPGFLEWVSQQEGERGD